MPLLQPSPTTLKKYGLSLEEWKALVEEQGHVCFVCKKEPSKGRLCIDHEHAKGWKKMPPEERKMFVRGVLCWYCNHAYLGRGINIERAKNVVKYLERYRDAPPLKNLTMKNTESTGQD